jgi:site-specific DNA-methyltransferase (adenine-specific)
VTLQAHHGDGLAIYPTLPSDAYTLIVSDGAYGIGGFPGDPKSPKGLAEWYRPHLEAWDRLAAPSSSLYFWCTPEGCARMLPEVEAHGWALNSRLVWSKGTGQCDLSMIRKWPDHFSEDCYVYTREAVDISALAAQGVTTGHDGLAHKSLIEAAGADERNTVRTFLRAEWYGRAGLGHPKGMGLTSVWGHYVDRGQWAFPTWDGFRAFAAYAREHGPPTERTYLVTEAVWARRGGLRESYEALREEYEALRYPFTLPQGVTDVWSAPSVSAKRRHSCAKRPEHIDRIVRASSRPGDRVLEPFGGGAPVLRACQKLGRSCDSIERVEEWHHWALAILGDHGAVSEPGILPGQGSLFG